MIDTPIVSSNFCKHFDKECGSECCRFKELFGLIKAIEISIKRSKKKLMRTKTDQLIQERQAHCTLSPIFNIVMSKRDREWCAKKKKTTTK